MKPKKIALVALVLGLSASTGYAINKEAKEIEKREQEEIYMCPMTETSKIREIRERCMRWYRDMEAEKTDSRLMYRCCMR